MRGHNSRIRQYNRFLFILPVFILRLGNPQALPEKGPGLAGGVRGVRQEGNLAVRGEGIKDNLIVLVDIGKVEVQHAAADLQDTMLVATDSYRFPSP